MSFVCAKLQRDLEEFERDVTRGPAPNFAERILGGKMKVDLSELKTQRLRRDVSVDNLSGSVDKDIYYWEPKSLRIKAINWWHVFLAEYVSYTYNLGIAVIIILISSQIWGGQLDIGRVRSVLHDPLVVEVIVIAAIVIAHVLRWKAAVYCIENVVYIPPADWQVSQAEINNILEAQGVFTPEALEFQKKILDNSGTGDSTHWPPGIMLSISGDSPGECNIGTARDEAREVIFSLARELLQKTGVLPSAIDFLIINCSLFCPTPSLCALVCNEFGLRQDVRSYNLGGMGCSANVISVDLAKQLLQNSPGSRAMVISTENITQNMYKGNEKGMLLQNTLFRCGGCALMLSSRHVDALRAKYKLLYTFRAQLSDNDSYQCVYQKEDANGKQGISLSKDIVSVAGKAMRQNFVQLGPYVLPLREQAAVVWNQLQMKFISKVKKAKWGFAKNWEVPKGYTPDFGQGIDHFCIHAGGRAVIEGVKKNLRLSDRQVAPSVQTLYDWGNTSSSSIWYELDWVERHANLRRGERILQIAFGSGFKCNSAVWVALRVDGSKRNKVLQKSRPANAAATADAAPAPAAVVADGAPPSGDEKKLR